MTVGDALLLAQAINKHREVDADSAEAVATAIRRAYIEAEEARRERNLANSRLTKVKALAAQFIEAVESVPLPVRLGDGDDPPDDAPATLTTTFYRASLAAAALAALKTELGRI